MFYKILEVNYLIGNRTNEFFFNYSELWIWEEIILLKKYLNKLKKDYELEETFCTPKI